MAGEENANAAGRVLRRVARALVRRNAFVDLRAYDGAMPRAAFLAVLSVLVLLRVYSIVCMVIAWQGWGLDPSTWATGEEVTTDLVTPFHHHTNPFGLVFQFFVIAHNFTGAALFATCLVPLLVRKGGKVHRYVGRAFVIVWLLHLVDGLANSGQILMSRGFDPLRYDEVTNQGFSLYLYVQFAFISSMVIDFLAHGLAAIHYKNSQPSPAIRALMILMPTSSALFGLGIALWGAGRLLSGVPPDTVSTIPFAVVFVVQVPAYLYLLFRNTHYWVRSSARSWLHGWLMEHQRNMMFCVQVTLYTGIANVAGRFTPTLAPLFFALIDVGFIVWILTKERSLRRHVVRSRLGLALVSSLRGARPRPTSELSSGDQNWIRRMFDLDRSGDVNLEDVKGLLSAQGVVPTAAELAVLRDRLDRNGDGRVDVEELGAFLSTWLTSYPSNEDELLLAFRGLDVDGDGRITPDELRAALAGGGDALDEGEIDRIMETSDLDDSGAIEWEEFKDAIHRRADPNDRPTYLGRDTRVG